MTTFYSPTRALWVALLRPALRWAARRCDVHDRPSEAKIAALEVATEIDPDAERRRWPVRQHLPDGTPLPYVVPTMDDPDLTDCGRAWCRARRGLT